MRTLFLLFAWVPIIMAYMAHGPGGVDYVFRTLLLLWFAVETLTSLAALASLRSRETIRADYNIRFRAALADGDLDAAREAISSEEMFLMRGAA